MGSMMVYRRYLGTYGIIVGLQRLPKVRMVSMIVFMEYLRI
jgi:hypothetical protein